MNERTNESKTNEKQRRTELTRAAEFNSGIEVSHIYGVFELDCIGTKFVHAWFAVAVA